MSSPLLSKETQGTSSRSSHRSSPLLSDTSSFSDFQVIQQIGRGSYGTVMAARHMADDQVIAIKRIEDPFSHRSVARQTLRELKILRLLKHENIISLDKVLLPKSLDEFQDIYMVTPLMETDLFSLIYHSKQVLLVDHIRFILYQILRGLKYQHSAKIIHRDLKPRNVLVNSNCEVKICDYGLARFYGNSTGNQDSNLMTDYVVSRWYRAPELLLGNEVYDEKVDVWAVGCIMAEIFLRRPLFKGNDWKDQLLLILKHYPNFNEDNLSFIENQNAVTFIKEHMLKDYKSIANYFVDSDMDSTGFDLLLRLLAFDPRKRLTIERALEHPFFKDLHYPPDEPVRAPADESEFSFEGQSLSKTQLKQLIYNEISTHYGANLKKQNIMASRETFDEPLEPNQVDQQSVDC
jgi:serine/threonine protein kinase